MRILIVEDDPTLRNSLERWFVGKNYVVDTAKDGEEALYYGLENVVDIAIIDLGLPEVDGITVIKRLRASGKTFPILILTARGRWQEKVEGLEAGADDYVVKPCQIEEITARVQAILRRSAGWSSSTLVNGPIQIDTKEERVTVNEAEVVLTSYEYSLLHYLMLRVGEVLSKTALLEHLYSDDDDRDSNVIEVFVRRLRKKLDPEGTLIPIETIRGRGYRLVKF